MQINRGLALFVCSTLLAIPVMAGNGNMLHGFGPVNSSMGGAGAALAMDPIGALMFNPAVLTTIEDNQVSFSTEFFEDGVEIEVTLNDGSHGVTNPSNQLGVLPAIGWTSNNPNSDWAIGFGLVAIAGFRTDYPEDPSSILFDTPPYGFGRIYTDHRVTRIPFAIARQVTDKLSIGGSLNTYLAELAIAPLPHRVYETVDGDDNLRFYPQGDGLVSEMAFSFQLGFLYEASPELSFGASYNSAQNYDPFVWNSTNPNPNDPDFGQTERLEFDLDGPANATVGLGWTPNEKTSVAFDVMWIEYEGVSGFGSPGGIVDRVVYPFGWKNVWVYKIGLDYQANDKITFRAGYNHSDNPIRSEVVLTATGAPATFSHHYSVGLGFQLNDRTRADMGFYYVPREHVTGPYPDLDNNVLGTMTTSNELKSIQIGLNWNF